MLLLQEKQTLEKKLQKTERGLQEKSEIKESESEGLSVLENSDSKDKESLLVATCMNQVNDSYDILIMALPIIFLE